MTLPGELLSESTVRDVIGGLVHALEAAGALIIFTGAVQSVTWCA
ncbi:hypothetical protein ACWCQL_22050 [Streptomyces sp. NPDC002073]